MEDISDESEEVADENDSHNDSHSHSDSVSTDSSGIDKQPKFEEDNEDNFNSCD